MSQVVEGLPSKLEALSLNPSHIKKKKKKKECSLKGQKKINTLADTTGSS
jgi:hypothetical protein